MSVNTYEENLDTVKLSWTQPKANGNGNQATEFTYQGEVAGLFTKMPGSFMMGFRIPDENEFIGKTVLISLDDYKEIVEDWGKKNPDFKQ